MTHAKSWGGRRAGAGRPPKGASAGAPHLLRAKLASRFPVHATWRLHKSAWRPREARCTRALSRAMHAGAARFGARLVQYAVIGADVHVLVEAPDHRALSRAMKGLGVRLARALNRVTRRHGRVISDRYRARILRTPSAARHARHQLAGSPHARAARRASVTALAARLILPRTRLLRRLIR